MSGELILPPSMNDASDALVKSIGRFDPFVVGNPNIQRNTFYAALIVEANKLPGTTNIGHLMKACLNLCMVGLIPGEALGHAYLIPFVLNRGKANEIQSVQAIVGYKGFLDLAFRNRFLSQCNVEVVLQGEDCERWHDADGPQIRLNLPVDRSPTKDTVVASFCTYRTRAGGRGLAWVSRSELNKVDTGRNVWRSDYVAMAKKTAVRRAAKEWQITAEMARAVMLDEQAERGDPQHCPELEHVEEMSGSLQGTRKTLSAVLAKCGCQSQDERDAVCSWTTGEETTAEAVMESEESMVRVISQLNEFTNPNGAIKATWKDVVGLAVNRGDS